MSRLHTTHRHQRYWRRNLRLTGALLGLWFVVTFGVCFFAGDLDTGFFGWPLGYWATSQGALVVYCAIVWVYALAMARLDREHRGSHED